MWWCGELWWLVGLYVGCRSYLCGFSCLVYLWFLIHFSIFHFHFVTLRFLFSLNKTHKKRRKPFGQALSLELEVYIWSPHNLGQESDASRVFLRAESIFSTFFWGGWFFFICATSKLVFFQCAFVHTHPYCFKKTKKSLTICTYKSVFPLTNKKK
jgi:hypothetical protein